MAIATVFLVLLVVVCKLYATSTQPLILYAAPFTHENYTVTSDDVCTRDAPCPLDVAIARINVSQVAMTLYMLPGTYLIKYKINITLYANLLITTVTGNNDVFISLSPPYPCEDWTLSRFAAVTFFGLSFPTVSLQNLNFNKDRDNPCVWSFEFMRVSYAVVYITNCTFVGDEQYYGLAFDHGECFMDNVSMTNTTISTTASPNVITNSVFVRGSFHSDAAGNAFKNCEIKQFSIEQRQQSVLFRQAVDTIVLFNNTFETTTLSFQKTDVIIDSCTFRNGSRNSPIETIHTIATGLIEEIFTIKIFNCSFDHTMEPILGLESYNAQIENSVFDTRGYAIYIVQRKMEWLNISNCLFTGNTAQPAIGGFGDFGDFVSIITIYNTTFRSMKQSIRLIGGNLRIIECSIWDNVTPAESQDGLGAINFRGQNFYLSSSVFQGNSPSHMYLGIIKQNITIVNSYFAEISGHQLFQIATVPCVEQLSRFLSGYISMTLTTAGNAEFNTQYGLYMCDQNTVASTYVPFPSPTPTPPSFDGSRKKGEDIAPLYTGIIILALFAVTLFITLFIYWRKKRRQKIYSYKPVVEIELALKHMTSKADSTTQYNLPKITDVQIGRKIGQGNFGSVYEGLWKGAKVALKTIPMENLHEIIQEAAVLQSLQHPNIVRFYGIFVTEKQQYMVTEFVSGGSLEDMLVNQPYSFTFRDLLRFARDAAAGMMLLEQNGVLHRDLAIRNLLIDSSKQEMTVKVADFGMARTVSSYTASTNAPVPVKWSSPEVLKFHTYSTKSDVWAMGIVIWELISLGQLPYMGLSNKEACEWVLKGNRLALPPETPPPLTALVMRCWEHEPTGRPSFVEIYQILSSLVETDFPPEMDPVAAQLRTRRFAFLSLRQSRRLTQSAQSAPRITPLPPLPSSATNHDVTSNPLAQSSIVVSKSRSLPSRSRLLAQSQPVPLHKPAPDDVMMTNTSDSPNDSPSDTSPSPEDNVTIDVADENHAKYEFTNELITNNQFTNEHFTNEHFTNEQFENEQFENDNYDTTTDFADDFTNEHFTNEPPENNLPNLMTLRPVQNTNYAAMSNNSRFSYSTNLGYSFSQPDENIAHITNTPHTRVQI